MDAWLPIQQLADSNVAGIVLARPDGLITDANDEFLRIVGYSRDDLNAGRLNRRRITPPEWALTALHADQVLDEVGKVAPFEKEYIRKDGSRVPVLVAIIRLPQPARQQLALVIDLSERKRAEQDLDRMLIERFAVLDSIGEGIYGVDLEGHCTFINTAAAQMLGYDPAECQGRKMHDLIHAKYADGSPYPFETCPIVGALRDCVGTRGDNEVLWRKDGLAFPVEYSCQPVVVGGRLEGAVVSFTDISARKLAERKLKASEERFRTAFRDAAAGMYITDLEGRYLEVNQAFCRFTGYSEPELLKLDFQRITHPDDVETSRSVLRGLVSGASTSVVTERRYIRKDGIVMFARCSVAALTDDDGSLVRLVGILEDISEQKKFQSDLRSTEGRYRSIVENAQEGICMCDGERQVTYCNSRLAEMLGYPADADVDCWKMHFLEDETDLQQRFERRKTGAGETFPTRLRRSDGSTVWANCSAAPIPNESGDFAGAVCMFSDVSAQKRLEERLLQVQKMEALGQLAGGIAHDFNNLLTVILGYCGVMERKIALEDPLLRTVVEVRKAGERAASLTQKLLAFSRKQVLSPRVIAVNDLIRDMASMLRRLIGENVELELSLDSAAGNVKADPGQIEQVVLNIAVNARDAMPRGGRLLVESKREALDAETAQVRSLHAGNYVLLTFSDNGCGMDEATKARIFEPFFTTKGAGVGTGLGLSTVLGIVRQSGGSITFYSEPGVGTTFKIYLPLVDGPAAETVSAVHAIAASRGETILLVEDDAGIRRLAHEVLEGAGYRVADAARAEDAFRIADEQSIDLLLTDVVLGGMNGYELARRLTKVRSALRVLYMSGYTEAGIMQQGMLDPGLNFLSKPFLPSGLLEKVSEVLRVQRGAPVILVADDDDQLRSSLADELQANGFRVIQASDGRQAQECCHRELPDLVLMDLVMPDREGLETIQAIRQNWPHLPVIAMSGVMGGAYLGLAQKLGATGVLRKPFGGAELLSEILRLMERSPDGATRH